MIRLTLRQSRAQALSALAVLAVVAIAVAITGPHLAYLYDTTVAACKAPLDCNSVSRNFVGNYSLLQVGLGALILVIPALIGMFLGAPLIARELEAGTYRLAWTQSVTRTRWFTVKVGLVGIAGAAATGLLSLLLTWWFTPIDKVNMNGFSPAVFDERGIIPIGYTAFAFALGLTAGLLIRRTVPAMAATLVIFVAVWVGATYWLRPNLVPPATSAMALSSSSNMGFVPSSAGVTFMADAPNIPNALVVSSRIVHTADHAPTDQELHQFLVTACPNVVNPPAPPSGLSRAPANQAVFQDCITQLSGKYHLAVTYQPASRYWAFQWWETAIFVGLAAILVGFGSWWIRRRIT